MYTIYDAFLCMSAQTCDYDYDAKIRETASRTWFWGGLPVDLLHQYRVGGLDHDLQLLRRRAIRPLAPAAIGCGLVPCARHEPKG